MSDARDRLERQAAWQKGRAALTWPEKVRMAEEVREWAAQLKQARSSKTGNASAPKQPGTGQAHSPQGQQGK